MRRWTEWYADGWSEEVRLMKYQIIIIITFSPIIWHRHIDRAVCPTVVGKVQMFVACSQLISLNRVVESSAVFSGWCSSLTLRTTFTYRLSTVHCMYTALLHKPYWADVCKSQLYRSCAACVYWHEVQSKERECSLSYMLSHILNGSFVLVTLSSLVIASEIFTPSAS